MQTVYDMYDLTTLSEAAKWFLLLCQGSLISDDELESIFPIL